MKRIYSLILVVIAISGCSVNQERIDANINNYRKPSKEGYEIVADMPYEEAFQMVVDILRDNNYRILKRDYKGKVILGSGDKYSVLMMDTPAFFFEEIGLDKTKFIIRGSRPVFFYEVVKEQIELRR